MTDKNNAAQTTEKAIRAAITLLDGDLDHENAEAMRSLLSKLRAEGVQAGDERAKFLAWANKEYGITEGYELNESQRDVLENQKGWMARAALASDQVAENASVVWKHTHRISGVIELSMEDLEGNAFNREKWESVPHYSVPQASAPVADDRSAFGRAEISFPMTIPGNRVYLAGPMTGIADHNFPAFNAAADRLRGFGLEVVNPADHGVVDGMGWADYMRWDLVKLAGCHSVYVLPGWEKSKGANLEVAIAQVLGMLVFTVEGEPLESAEPVDLAGIDADRLRAIAASGSHTAMSNALLNVARALKSHADKDGAQSPANRPEIHASIESKGGALDGGDCAKGAHKGGSDA